MYQDIESSSSWRIIKPIKKGWSKDLKYYIETMDHEKLLLRITDISHYDQKQKEYEMISKYSRLGFKMSIPIDFGTCHNNQCVYMILTWIEGIDLEEALPQLSTKEQYELGREAGMILKQIHTIKVPKSQLPTETKIPKKIIQLNHYVKSNVRLNNDQGILEYIESNIHKMWTMRPCYLHGDFHPGNLILTPKGTIGVIDFNRWEIGDPYEEFYKLQSFGTDCSIPYCIGQIHAYFEEQVPLQFWETLSVYVAHASLYSIVWAEKFGQSDVDKMIKRAQIAFKDYDYFKSIIPRWYLSNSIKE